KQPRPFSKIEMARRNQAGQGLFMFYHAVFIDPAILRSVDTERFDPSVRHTRDCPGNWRRCGAEGLSRKIYPKRR
ncbi:hypothetical protein, partial [Burkholderia pseudomallei]|uniref:hypothetical protein n=1 Tax=Burkholderia pseudomallei TaxID=28450 RepID=UPI001C3E4DAE